jgi:WD40 repeat protein
LYSTTNNRLHVWRAGDDFGLVKEVETRFGAIYSLGVTRKFLVTGTHSQNIQVYDRASLSHHCTLNGHIGIVTVLRVTESPVGVFMFSGSSDTTVQVWNLENMLPIMALQRHEKPVQALAVCQDSVFTGSEDMEIKVFRHFKL